LGHLINDNNAVLTAVSGGENQKVKSKSGRRLFTRGFARKTELSGSRE
jgi:hypothetical protein